MSGFQFFADSGLTVPIDADNRLEFVQAASGSAVDAVLFYGSPDATKKLQKASNPGVDDLTVQIVDADAETGLAITAAKLALSAAGLDTATPGAALDIGPTINGGAVNAVAIFVRMDAATATPAVFEDLELRVVGAPSDL